MQNNNNMNPGQINFTAERFPSVAAIVQISLYFDKDPGAQAILAAVTEVRMNGQEAQRPANFAANVAKFFTPENRDSYDNLCQAYRDNYERRYLVPNQVKNLLRNL